MRLMRRRGSVLGVLFLVAALFRAAHAETAVPTLTPRDAVGWMAPLRIENGRLDIDWSTVGLLAAKHAGISTNNGVPTALIDTDVKFLVALGNTPDAPHFELVLHASGESIVAAPVKGGATKPDLPIEVKITDKTEEGKSALRGDLLTHGRLSTNGDSYDISEMQLNLDSPTCLVLYALNRKSREFRFKFKEERVLKCDLSITQSNNILMVKCDNTDVGTGFELTQKPNGEAELTFSQGEIKRFVRGADLHELLQKNTAEMQLNFLRPLSETGVDIALCPELPVAMAAATTGFSEPLPDVQKKADVIINSIATGATPELRAGAVTDLTRFFPQAIFHITKARDEAADPGLKAALQKVIDGHPGIACAMPYVKQRKLQDDREYLFEIFERVPLLKDAARARLVLLLGKDYGDDPEKWKKGL